MTAREEREREREPRERWPSERTRRAEHFSPRSPQAVDLAGLFSLLPVVRRFRPFLPGFFPPRSVLFLFCNPRFRRGRSVSGNTHARARARPPLPLAPVVARSVHAQGGICYAFRCIEHLPGRPAADILFHSIISLTVSSPQSDRARPGALTSLLRSTALFVRTRRVIIVGEERRFFTSTFNRRRIRFKDRSRSLTARTIDMYRLELPFTVNARSKFAETFYRLENERKEKKLKFVRLEARFETS